MKTRRVVITGLGVVAPIGTGLVDFENALRNNRSGIRRDEELVAASFACQVSGVPQLHEEVKAQYIPARIALKLKNSAIIYGIVAGMQAWEDAGLQPAPEENPDWESGCIFGAGMSGIEMIRDAVYQVDAGKVKVLGSRFIERTMASGISAHLGGLLGMGNQVSTNASACSTGTEAVLLAWNRIAHGEAECMLAGGCDGNGAHIWAGFDSMMVLNRDSNEVPAAASRPLSASARGFVPGAGAAGLVLESLERAQARGARIYAEVLGGAVNSGGQRGEGSMTIPNPQGAQRCITAALQRAGVKPAQVDAISGHLTGTKGDAIEIANWVKALGRSGSEFPFIHSLKSLTGHCLSAAGAIECAAAVIQLQKGFFHASVNSEDLHPGVEERVHRSRIPLTTLHNTGFDIMVKASFGFGDVNACAVFRRWQE